MTGEPYQVVYCLVAKYRMGDGNWWENWYLLKCPLVGLISLDEAREVVRAWKGMLGAIFQPVIIGETKGCFDHIGMDDLFGVTAIGGLDASQAEQPNFILSEDLRRML